VHVGDGLPELIVTVGFPFVAADEVSGKGGGMNVIVAPLQACVMGIGGGSMLDSATTVVGTVVTLTFQKSISVVVTGGMVMTVE
jgi:hypothetical protein